MSESVFKSGLSKFAGIVAFGLAFAAVRYALDWNSSRMTGLQSSTRHNFVDAGMKTCMKTQMASPDNHGVPPETVAAYCSCYMNNLADSLSPSELSDDPKDQPAILRVLQPKIEKAAKPCLDEVAKSSVQH